MASPLSPDSRYSPQNASLDEALLTAAEGGEAGEPRRALEAPREDSDQEVSGNQRESPSRPAAAASLSSTVATLCIGVLGTGQLALPYAVSLMGVAVGMAALALMGCVAVTTLYMLAECRQATRSGNYGEVLHKVLGPGFANVANFLLALYAWGGGVTFMMILGIELEAVVRDTAGPAAPSWGPSGYLLAAVALCVLPLSCCRHLDSLRFTSTMGACAALYITAVVVGEAAWPAFASGASAAQCHGALPACVPEGPQCHEDTNPMLAAGAPLLEAHLWPVLMFLGDNSTASTAAKFRLWPGDGDLSWFHVLFNVTSGLAMFGFALNSHWCFVPVMAAMKAPTPRRTTALIASSQTVVLLNYLLISFSGYFSFCNDTKDDILQNLGKSPAVILARAMLVAQLCFALPLRFSVTRGIVKRFMFGQSSDASHHPDHSLASHILLTVAVVGSAAATAASASSISLAMSLASTVCASAICYVFPAMSFLSLQRKQQQHHHHHLRVLPSRLRRATAYAILAYGSLMMVGGTAVNIAGAIRGFVVVGGR
eukprot:CAMPEP_0117659378 /NCGR_PEP_ID=MMETSP0804-20121206/6401_1 /TAXON_ID=1074897 /ORGANISM="Tetraselmis astigmatica, Strain CCMP880" /LENGTH=541 /DNA_ID=CAMNT_0005466033 /DNA_START=40 /DNA_END=1665 /DNA_ORIENTATION=+